MKTLEEMGIAEKGKLLADLLPEELPGITRFIEQETQRFLKNEQKIRNSWTAVLVTDNCWFQLVRDIQKAINYYGSRLHKNHRCFARQLFDDYQALFTIYCLVEYSEKTECSYRLRKAVHLLFGEVKLVLTAPDSGDNEKNNAFADWLFNEYVKAHRKSDKCTSRHFWNVLMMYSKIGFPNESKKDEREYTEKLNKIIQNAFPDWNTHLLILRGEEGRAEYAENMAGYEKRLRAIGHSEKEIQQMINKKIQLNYGND